MSKAPGKTPKQSAAPKQASKAEPEAATGKKPNALQQKLQPSAELAAVIGADPIARGAAVSRLWAYIKEHKLQNPKDGREILADGKLEKVFGTSRVTMFEMNRHLARHLA